jgi:hypothetical protein
VRRACSDAGHRREEPGKRLQGRVWTSQETSSLQTTPARKLEGALTIHETRSTKDAA